MYSFDILVEDSDMFMRNYEIRMKNKFFNEVYVYCKANFTAERNILQNIYNKSKITEIGKKNELKETMVGNILKCVEYSEHC